MWVGAADGAVHRWRERPAGAAVWLIDDAEAAALRHGTSDDRHLRFVRYMVLGVASTLLGGLPMIVAWLLISVQDKLVVPAEPKLEEIKVTRCLSYGAFASVLSSA